MVDTDLAKFIDEYSSSEPLLIGQDVVQQGGFPCPQKPGQDRDRNRAMAVSRSQGHRERFSHQCGV